MADEGVVDATTAELVDLSRAGRAGRHHVRYEQSDGTTMELWRCDAELRQDVVTPGGEELRVYRIDGTTTRCEQPADDGWECVPADDPTASDVVAQLVDDLEGATFEVEDDEVAGIEVRCFSSAAEAVTGAEQVQICFTREGVLARLSADGERLEMVAFDRDVPDDVFTPPADSTG